MIFGKFDVDIEPGGPFHLLIIGIFGLCRKSKAACISVLEARPKPFVFPERFRAGPSKTLSNSIAEEIPAVNVVYIAVFIVITAVSSLFAWIGPDEIRKSRMRNIEPAVDDGDDYFRFFSGGGGEFYLLPHKSLSYGHRIANRKRTKNKGHPFVQMTVLPPTDTRQKIILLNSYCNRYLTRQI